MDLVIRPAVQNDEAAIVALHVESWRQSYRGALPDSYLDGALATDMRKRWHRRLIQPRPGWTILVAQLDDSFAGFLAAGPDPEDPARDLIDNLHVAASLRRQGIGAALMREGADRLASLGRGPAILWVGAANQGARAFYGDLGGVEGPEEAHPVMPGIEMRAVAVRWDSLTQVAFAARQRLARRLDPPLALASTKVPMVTGAASGADHPVAAGAKARLRRKQRLGDPFGLTDYGINLVELDPGAWSSIPHWHSREDEFVYLLEGELVLVSGAADRLLRPGDCAGFPAGLDRPHHLENRTSARSVYLEVGSRRPDRDEVDYPGEDLRIAQLADDRRAYVRRDGSPLDSD